jgi:hypothetical protein
MNVFDIEQNDVDISKLFRYTHVITLKIPGEDTDLRLYQKLCGDSEINIARTRAMRKSAELRKNLSNPTWKDRIAYIPDTQRVRKAQVLELLLSLYITGWTRDAIADITISRPVSPEPDANLEEREEYQKEIDAFPKRVEEEILKYIGEKKLQKRKELEGYTKATLVELQEEALIVAKCEEMYMDTFLEMCTWLGTFTDDKFTRRTTKEFEEFENLPKETKEFLIANYTNIDIPSTELKK